MKDNVYTETQSFLTRWLCGLLGVLIYIQIEQLITADKTLHFSDYISLVILALVLILVLFVRLHTTIDERGITILFFPFIRKTTWEWERIEEVYVTQYSIADYGGWGYRLGKNGKAYNTKGKHGLQLIMKNGERIMVGTQRPEIVNEVIAKIKNK